MLPSLNASVEVVGCGDLLVTSLFDGVDEPLGNDHRGVTTANLLPPQFRESLAGPGCVDGCLVVDAIAFGTSIVRPRSTDGRGCGRLFCYLRGRSYFCHFFDDNRLGNLRSRRCRRSCGSLSIGFNRFVVSFWIVEGDDRNADTDTSHFNVHAKKSVEAEQHNCAHNSDDKYCLDETDEKPHTPLLWGKECIVARVLPHGSCDVGVQGLRRAVGGVRARLWHWRTRIFTRYALGATARRVEVVREADHPAPTAESLVVVSLMRDAGGYVDSFVAHYRELGAAHIVLLDNGSSDDTVERATGYEGVTVLRCDLPFRWYRTAMRRYLVETYGDDSWVLLVDIDEHWDYPLRDANPLPKFLAYLNVYAFTAVAAHMLDLFPAGPVNSWPDAGPELTAASVWFDLADVRSEPLPAVACRNEFAGKNLPCLVGGLRTRAFAAEPCLTKFPLTRRAAGHGPKIETAHFISGAAVADVTTVLLHYKFDSRFRQRTAEAVRRKNYYGGSSEYRQYQAALKQDAALTLDSDSSEKLDSVDQLLAREFVSVSGKYRAGTSVSPDLSP